MGKPVSGSNLFIISVFFSNIIVNEITELFTIILSPCTEEILSKKALLPVLQDQL
jgi:hypothetical protein